MIQLRILFGSKHSLSLIETIEINVGSSSIKSSPHQTRRLQLVQNAAARIITETSQSHHITPVLMQLHWLPIEQRILFKNLVFIYSCINGSAPGYLSELVKPYVANRSLRSQDQHLLQIQRTVNKYGDRAFVHFAPRIWNSLPISIRKCDNLFNFKKSLKTHLFRLAYINV